MAQMLTAYELRRRIAHIPDNANIYVYTGEDGTKVQAEWPSSGADDKGRAVIINAPSVVLSCGGPAE